MTLEEQLRDAAAKGMTDFTLYPVPSVDNKTVYWRARATPSTMHKFVQVTEKDPVAAVMAVLKALPRATRKSEKVTAAVKRIGFQNEQYPISPKATSTHPAAPQAVGDRH